MKRRPIKVNPPARPRLAGPLALAVACAAAMVLFVPAGFEAQSLYSIRNDPAAVSEHMLDHSFDAAVARREIDAALAYGDAELAQSFLDLAHDRGVPVDADQAERVKAANSTAANATRTAGSFARGLVTGEPTDMAGLAGTALGDLFVFGDVRDAAREGSRLATGQPADKLILGLAATGIVITAGTYATVGVTAPVRLGLSVLKGARSAGRMSVRMGEWLGRSLRDVLDFGAVARALGSASIAEPVVAVRAVREAVKVDKAEELLRVAGDVGRIEGKAGTQAALESLKLAEGPRDMSRLSKLAEKYGGKTRAVLKLGGRAAIWLTLTTFQLLSFIVVAALNLFGFCAACKRSVERATERYCRRRRRRRYAAAQAAKLAEVKAAAATAQEPAEEGMLLAA